MRLRTKAWLLALASAMVCATAAIAEDYPAHPVKLVVSYPPGGGLDVVARIVGQRMSQILKQPFVVENKPGAGGILGASQTAKAAPDGYTLMVAEISQLAIVPYLYKDVPYDPLKDFTPIGLAVVAPVVIVANAKTTKIKTLADLIRLAKASPGSINYGSTGIGSMHHLAMEAFKADAGIDVVHIPYKGAGQSIPALVGGEIQLVMAGLTQAAPLAKSGQANLLAVTSARRFPDAPDVPSVGEFYKGYDYSSEIGFVGPPGMAPEIVAKLSSAMQIALEDREIQEKIRQIGIIPYWLSPQDYANNIRENLKKYKRVVEVARIAPN